MRTSTDGLVTGARVSACSRSEPRVVVSGAERECFRRYQLFSWTGGRTRRSSLFLATIRAFAGAQTAPHQKERACLLEPPRRVSRFASTCTHPRVSLDGHLRGRRARRAPNPRGGGRAPPRGRRRSARSSSPSRRLDAHVVDLDAHGDGPRRASYWKRRRRRSGLPRVHQGRRRQGHRQRWQSRFSSRERVGG